MSFTKRVWTDPIKLDASNINRLEQGVKNSFDNIEIMKEEVLSLQLNNAKLNSKVSSLLSDSPTVLKTLTDITTILNSNTSILDTLKDTSNFLTKTQQTLTQKEVKQIQKNLGINKFLHLTDIKLNDISIVNGSEINITIPKPDTELSATSSNALANSVVYQSLKNLSKSIKYSDIIDAPSYKDIASNHNHDGIYALLKHYHSEYAISNHDHDTKYANIVHDHNNIYSLQNHTHNNYASLLHTHANYAHVIHDHDMDYATVSHTHTESQIIDLQNYALLNHTHDNRYPSLSHTHTDYATINHTHSDMLIEIERLKEELEDTIDSIDKNTNFVTKDYVDENGGKIDKILINGVVLPITNKSIDITIPTTLDQLQNTPGFISEKESKEYTDYAIDQLVNGAPGTLDTLNELATAINDNKDIITTLNSAITNKADKVHTHTEHEIIDLKDYALSSHKHTEKDITDLKDYSLVGHTHKESEITDLKNYALKSHTHLSTDISNLDAILSNYALTTHNHNDLYSLLNHTHTESEITDLKNYALKSHAHDISDITSLSTQLNTTLSTAKSYTDTEIETISVSFIEALDTHTHTKSEITDFNHTHDYLPLTAGSTKPLTDDLYITSNKYIRLGNHAFIKGDDTDGRLTISAGKDRILTIRPNPDNSTGQMHIYGTVFRPGSKDGVQLGSDSAPWSAIYGTTLYQNGKQVANKEDIPDTSIFIPQGGTLTAPLKVTGGDQTTAGKIILDQNNKGQITNTGTQTLFGFNTSTTLAVGHTNYVLALRGSGTRPKFNSNDMALFSDIPTDYAANSHTHTISEITNIPDYSLTGHTHTFNNIIDAIRYTETLVPYGTAIPANANLNTTNYIKVGNYYCSANATVQTFSNCPTTLAFMMRVYSPLSTTIDNEATQTWCYRLREIITYTGDIYTQQIYSDDTAGHFVYPGWKKVANSTDLASYSQTSHTHTKSQITDFDHTHSYFPLSGGYLSEGASVRMTGSNPLVGLMEYNKTQYYLQAYQGEVGMSVGGKWGTARISLDSTGKVIIPSKLLSNGTYNYTLPDATGTVALKNEVTTLETNINTSLTNFNTVLGQKPNFSYYSPYQSTTGKGTLSYYAHWKIEIGAIKIIGGATPESEGNKTVYFRMNNSQSTNIFTSEVMGFWSGGKGRTSSTGNGWQYANVSDLSYGNIVQVSTGSYWVAIGR